MSADTKRKLKKWIPDEFVRDLLEAQGILYPHQIKDLDDSELVRAGLRVEEIQAVRAKLPSKVSAESKAE